MRQKVATTILQVVDPFDTDWLVKIGFDRESRIVERPRMADGAVAPYGRHGQTGGENLLFELSDGDFVVVCRAYLAGFWHGRRNDEGHLIFRNRQRIK
jgi:hypothetical protein